MFLRMKNNPHKSQVILFYPQVMIYKKKLKLNMLEEILRSHPRRKPKINYGIICYHKSIKKTKIVLVMKKAKFDLLSNY